MIDPPLPPAIPDRLARPPSPRDLAVHETRIHAGRHREVRELGFGLLLFDPADAEPFWNRLAAPELADEPGSFDRQAQQAIVLFGTLGRYPHVRPLAAGNRPADLAQRLVALGFDVVAEDRSMVLHDAGPALALVARPLPDGVAIERIRSGAALPAGDPLADVAATLRSAFGVDAAREVAIAQDARSSLAIPRTEFVLVRHEGAPVAVAKRTSRRGAAYLSSIGTRPGMRGRGYGRLATAVAIAGALADGDRRTHLVVEADNHAGLALYRGLGFAEVGGVIPDLLLLR